MTSNEDIRDRAISHQIYLLRYESKVTDDILEILKQSESDIEQKLLGINTEWSTNRLNKQLESIRSIINASWEDASDSLSKEIGRAHV